MVLTAEEKKSTGGQTALIQFAGKFKVKGDIFFILWKQLSPGKWKPVYKSAAAPNRKGNWAWHEALLNTNFLCNGNEQQEFRADFLMS